MDGANVNGGNAEAPREDSNLENSDATVLTAETRDSLSSKTQSSADGNAEAQEVNGDVKGSSRKPGAVSLRRKMRKSKANSTSTVESDGAETLGVSTRKRKHSEFDDASSEDSEFNGFDSQVLELQPGSLVLKKLIAEAEIAEAQYVKRIRYSNRSFDGREKKEDDQDIDDMRAYIYETDSLEDVGKVKKESDKSETDSMDISNSIDSEAEPSKIEDISMRSANSSSAASSPSAASQRSKSSRFSRGLSPGGKHRSPIDMSNPLYKEPFKYGWKRELVFRATNDSAFKRMADIYYYTPKGKKVRSFREVAESLNSKELTIDNFTFFKEPIGLDDPEKEIIRDAKRIRGSGGYTTGRKSFGRKSIAAKKPVPEPVVKKPVQEPVTRRSAQESAARKSVQEPLASVPAPAPAPTPAPTPVTEASKLTPPVSVPTRAATKAKASTSPAYKTKAAAKKTPQIKMKSAAEEPEMLPPQRSTPNTRRNQQAVEKVTSVKTKRLLTPKVQEPCSIRCSTSMGLIPSLQCRVCLCLYHPECVDGMEFAGSDEYVCKNCQPDTKESHTSNNPSLTPPPLIPISMLGAQNTKSKHQTNSAPPKLQRIPKSDGADTQTRNSSRISKTPSNVGSKTMSNASSNVDRTEAAWFPQTENEFLQSHDGDVPKPAQNIAVMGGKRYIVVPKNNAMAVQPARVKPDKIGDKPPILPDGSLTDISNTVDNSAVKSRTVPPKSLNDDPPEKANITPDEEITKDDSTLSTDFASSAITETETFDSKDNKDDKDNSPKEDQSIEDISVENESSTASIVDCVPEKENADLNCKSPDNKSACTPTSIASTANTIDEANVEIIQTDDQQLLSSKEGTVKKVKHSK